MLLQGRCTKILTDPNSQCSVTTVIDYFIMEVYLFIFATSILSWCLDFPVRCGGFRQFIDSRNGTVFNQSAASKLCTQNKATLPTGMTSTCFVDSLERLAKFRQKRFHFWVNTSAQVWVIQFQPGSTSSITMWSSTQVTNFVLCEMGKCCI